MASNNEARLCPDCPRKSLLPLVRNESYTNTPALDTTVKLCAKLRAFKDTRLPKCPYFNDDEDITRFFGRRKKKH